MHYKRDTGRIFIGVPAALALALLTSSIDARGAELPPLERVGTIALRGAVGGLDHLALDTKRGRLFVANTANDSLDIVDLKAGTLLKQITGQGRIRGVTYSPEVNRIFVGNGDGGVCNTFDGESYELLRSVSLGADADNVRYSPRTHRIYVVHADTELSVIDAKDFTLLSPIALPKSLGAFQLEAKRPRMYINAKDAGVVVAIELDSDRIINRFDVAPAGVNAALANDEPNHRLFVGCRRDPSLVVMDSDTGKDVDRVPIPGDVDDVSFHARNGRIYASCGDGAIAVIRRIGSDRYQALTPVATVKGARTSILDSEDGHFYLAVPRRADRPAQAHAEVWVYQVRS